MKPSAKALFGAARDSHELVYKARGVVADEIEKCANMVELCDYALAVDQAHAHIEDLKKALFTLRERINRRVCEFYVISNPTEVSIRTDYVTATPDVSFSPKLPSHKSDPAGFANMMKALGIPENLYAGESEAIRPHWPGLVEYVKKALAAGKPCPPGIDISSQTTIYKLVLRKIKDVLA